MIGVGILIAIPLALFVARMIRLRSVVVHAMPSRCPLSPGGAHVSSPYSFRPTAA